MNKHILITGANGALGSVVTRHLIHLGNKVTAIDNSMEKISELISGSNLKFYGADVTDERQMLALISNIIKEEGQIHGALLLVGGFKTGSVSETNLDTLTDMIRWNFFSSYNVARMVFGHMQEKGYGRIIFISSKPGVHPKLGKNMVGYAIGKNMLLAYSDILNAAADGKDITSSVIVPSIIDTPSNRRSMPDADFSKWVTPQQIAEIIELIFSEKGNALRENVLKLYHFA